MKIIGLVLAGLSVICTSVDTPQARTDRPAGEDSGVIIAVEPAQSVYVWPSPVDVTLRVTNSPKGPRATVGSTAIQIESFTLDLVGPDDKSISYIPPLSEKQLNRPYHLEPGASVEIHQDLFWTGQPGALVFPGPGAYRLFVQAKVKGGAHAVAAPAMILIKEADVPDVALSDRLGGTDALVGVLHYGPRRFCETGHIDDCNAWFVDLLDGFGKSAYTPWIASRVAASAYRDRRITNSDRITTLLSLQKILERHRGGHRAVQAVLDLRRSACVGAEHFEKCQGLAPIARGEVSDPGTRSAPDVP